MRSTGLFDSPGDCIPELPELLADLMAITPNMPARRVVRMFRNEPELAETLQSMAEAPYYCGRRPLDTLGRILERVGLAGMRGLTIRASLDDLIYDEAQPLHNQIRRHGTASAYATTVLGRYTPLSTDRLFIAALLQNVGLAIPLNSPASQDIPETELWLAIRYAHEGISGLAVSFWQLSEEVQCIVNHHHQLGRGLSDDRDVAALVVADYVVSSMDLGIDHPAHPELDEGTLGLALDILELTSSQLPDIQREVSDLLMLIK
jgi:HD-like signal output (HDOD) protein